MAAADTPNSVSVSPTEQLTAPSGWTKKLVPAKGTNITLRKYDVVFIAPGGQEIPSLWHLRRYLKAHPEGPALSEFNWSSGEESVRRSARASIKEVSYSEKRTQRGKGKRNAADMDAEGEEEDKVKTPARKRAKKAGKDDSSVIKDNAVSTDKDEVMHEVPEGAAAGVLGDVKDTALETAVRKDDVDRGSENGVNNAKEEQLAAQNAVSVTIHKEQKVEEVMEQVVEVKEHVLEVKEQVEVVVATSVELQVVEAKGALEVSPLVVPSNELKGEEPVVECENLVESFDASVMESKEPLHSITEERHEGEKAFLEPLMQKE
ncbi:hypothetical protein L7F22_058521 [Adiantum nelumboides]|nr:hypothetical protein [Adiantum nelumboides]